MKRIDAIQLDALLQGAKTIEEDGLGVKVARLGSGDFLKLYRRKRLLSSDLWDLPAQRFADNARGLLRLGVIAPTVLDVLMISERRLSAVLYQPLPGDTLRNRLRQLDAGQRPALVRRFGTFLGELHQLGVYFRSLHLGNVLLLPDDSFGLIDLSDMKLESRPLAPWKRRRNLQHILRYAEDIDWLAHQHVDSWLEGYADSASRRDTERFSRDLRKWLQAR
ncbi:MULTISPECIES: lipopolysaccharide kinase InaA family protein [unclassified Pseudomonas]|uniref:lipopolysaccharide kinase InaA family protein n=1 Tax=unclassified Pseudomonas TaxID=196821 RepID=UPI00095D8D10|nr:MULTISPECIES: lipopolysaccharide kinase InaA family protein [unclassified Pseudomonas]OLU16362.1 polymerase [Pseudomonas sp. PA1(2017)]OLU34514.1 polymerase [Pseudomonas sp. PA27(2017)]